MAERTLRIEISVDDKGTVKLKQFGGAMDSTVKKTGTLKQGFTHLESAAQRMERSLFSLRNLLVSGIGLYTISRLIRSSTEAAQAEETAIRSLHQVLVSMGRYTPELERGLIAEATALEHMTGFGNDAIIMAQKFLGTYSQIADEVLPRALRATLDIARGWNVDLRTAANIVGKASMGLTGELSRYGITLSEETKKSKDFISILRDMESQVKGQAEAGRWTAEGIKEHFKAVRSDVEKQFGYLINEVMAPFYEAAAKYLTGVAEDTKDWRKETDRTVEAQEILLNVMEGTALGLAKIIDLMREAQIVMAGLGLAASDIGIKTASMMEALSKIPVAGKIFGDPEEHRKYIEQAKQDMEGLVNKIDKLLADIEHPYTEKVKEAFKDIRAAVAEAREEIAKHTLEAQKGGKTVVETAEEVGEKLKEIEGRTAKDIESIAKQSAALLEKIHDDYMQATLSKEQYRTWQIEEAYKERTDALTEAAYHDLRNYEKYVKAQNELDVWRNEALKKITEDTASDLQEVYESVWTDIRRNISDTLGELRREAASFRDFMGSIWESIGQGIDDLLADMITKWARGFADMKSISKMEMAGIAAAIAGIGIAGGAGGGEIATTTAATAAMLAGYPEIAVATIALANIGRAVFKGRVDWVQAGAPAAGMAGFPVGLQQGFGLAGLGIPPAVGAAMVALGVLMFSPAGLLTAILGFTAIFGRKWPTVRGALEVAIGGLKESSEFAKEYYDTITESGKVWIESTSEIARVIVVQARDVEGNFQEAADNIRRFADDVVQMWLDIVSLLPEDAEQRIKEAVPDIEIMFAAGRKDMEDLGRKIATSLLIQTYLSFGTALMDEFGKIIGRDLFELFGLPKTFEDILKDAAPLTGESLAEDIAEALEATGAKTVEELIKYIGTIDWKWEEELEALYAYTVGELMPTVEATVKWASTMANLMEKYGKEAIGIYIEGTSEKIKDILDAYTPEIRSLLEKAGDTKDEVEALEQQAKEKAEELGKTVDEYLSALVDWISEVENTIAKYTMPEPAFELWELENWYKDMAAQAEALGVSTERLNEALARKFFKPIEDLLDTRSDYEKTRADIEEWYWAHLAFFEAHREMLEALGYSIEDIINAYNKLLEQLEEARQERIAEAFDRIRSIVEEFTIGAEELAGIGMERLRGRWLDRSLEYYREHWDELMADAQEYMNLEIELYELRKNKLIEETEAVIAGYRDRMAELEDLKREWESVAQSAASAINELRFGSTAGLRPVEAWPLIRAEYERLKAAALTSPEAAREFLEFYPTYLEYARDMYKSSEAYQLILADVLSVLEFIQTYAEDQVSELEAQTRALESAITSAELALENALEALRVETADRLQAVSDWLSEILAAINAIEQPDINITVTTGTGTATTVAGQPQNVVMGAISGVKYPHAPGRLPMQEGGIVTEPILAQLHPQEAVIPLDRGGIIDYDRLAKAVRIDEEKLAKALARELEGGPPKTIILRLEPREFKRWFRKASENREVIIGE